MRKMSSGRHLIALAFLSAWVTGCAGSSPTAPSLAPEPAAPSAPAASGTLTIRVLSRTTERPIAGATIVTPTSRLATDQLGVGTITVVPGEEIDVQVSAEGYDTMGASAVVGPSERWTFYLPALVNLPAGAQ